jgi:ENTS family enterobactin (siderophore) exporter
MLLPLLLFLSAPYPALLMGSIVWGLGAPMLWTSSLVHVMNASAPTRFGAATGFVRGTATLAQLMGMYILGELYEWRGMEALFLFAIAGSGVAAAAMMVSPRGGFTAARPRWQSFVAVMRRPDTITMCALLLFSGLAYGIVLNRFKAHVESIHGPGGLSLVLPFFFIAAIASNYGGGALSDRWGRWTTIAGGYAVGAAGMLAAGIWTHTALMALALLCIGVLFAVVPLSGFAWVGDQTPPEDRASVMGYIFCFRDLGVAVGIMSASLFASSLTLFRAFGVFFLLCALAGFIMVRLQRTSAAA